MSFTARARRARGGPAARTWSRSRSPRACSRAEIAPREAAGCGATTCARPGARPRSTRALRRQGRARASRASCSRPPTSSRRASRVARARRPSSSPTFKQQLREGGPALRAQQEPDALRRADHRLAGRARGAGRQGAAADRLGDLQPAPRRHPARTSTRRPLRRRQLERPLRQSELQNPSPYNTRVHRACRPGRSATRAWRRSRPPPTRPRPSYLFYVVKPSARRQHNFAATDAQFQRYVTSTTARARQARRQVADELLTALAGVLGYPVGHSRSPAMMNAAFARARARLALREAAGAARALRGDRARAARLRLPRART